MKLSMWILSDWLKDYEPKTRIIHGDPVLKNVRLFSCAKATQKSNVYIGRARDILGSEENKVICVNGQDMIFLETEDIEQVLTDILNAFDYYNDWFEKLQESITSGCSLQYLIDCARNFFDEIISMADPGYSNITLSIPANMDMSGDFYKDMLRNKAMQQLDIIMEINRDSRIREVNRKDAYIIDSKLLPCRLICANLVCNNQHLGWISMLERNHPNTQGRMDIFSAYARTLESWLSCNKTQNEFKSYQQFFLDLLNGRPGTESTINQHFQAIGWDPSDDKMIVSINCIIKKDIMLTLTRRIENWFPACLGVFYKDWIVVICNLALMNKSDFRRKFKEITEPSDCFCGISYIFNDTAQAPLYFEQTIVAAKYGSQESGSLNECSDHAVAYGLDIIKQNVQTDIKHPAIKILQKYDKDTNSDLSGTLKNFLENERNYTLTANILSIHKNSLKYRLSRINDLTDIDLDTYDIRLHLLLSFYLN
ncbi:PucR family transcriptional regulator [Desulfosporosinus lacus]|uniref:PucR C-terminal helix-turn-helix domain-containing protein n=1 Tax=Desulfosporosinus lacus DSM 15449 TaxID=1121420 RepID=A0A1M6D373_9FIRM|nr:helix-turn-helix domain-containing protein [Desulfosporosinus lacus]SHI67543.1 PucR C-terminal helix-turn-helix domain-containing protein [Desulfosporosinus lacus DSM 15449]